MTSKGMAYMKLNKREKGSSSDNLKVKSLKSRWFSLEERSSTKKGSEEPTSNPIKRGVVVTLKEEKNNLCVVCGIFNKHYNKWFLSDKSVDISCKTAHRLQVRRVIFHAGHSLHSLVDGSGSNDMKKLHKLVDLAEVGVVKGDLRQVN